MLSSELDADRNPVRGYVYGNEYISQNNGSSSGYYLNDEQGSILYLTGSDGSIRNHYRYSAFGESITAEETVPNRLKYNAQMADELTGLYYLRARYYNASLGRFTQEDVIYNDGLNLYAYCNSNPVMYSDPSGFAKETCKSKVGGECDSESGNSSIHYGELDSLGRATGVDATITVDMVGTGTPAKSSIKPAGFGGQKAGHARGHLLGNQLGGAGDDPRNLTTLFQNPVNHPVMSSVEGSVRKAVEAGEVVRYSVKPIYEGNTLIPSGVTIKAEGDKGFYIYQTILNRK